MKKYSVRFCSVCESDFTPGSSNQKYCSERCREKNREFNCILCGTASTAYYSKRSEPKYCSKECRNRGWHLSCHRYENDELVEKKCCNCNKWLTLDNFIKSSNRKSGYYNRCNVCKYYEDAKKKYGIEEESVKNLPNVCEICGSKEKLCIDHCHESGIVRGRLCESCNFSLGLLKEDEQRIENLLKYVRERCNLASSLVA